MSWCDERIRCVDRFAVLSEHFRHLVYQDIARLDDEAILATIPLDLRLLATIFVLDMRQLLARREESLRKCGVAVVDGVLDARGRVLSYANHLPDFGRVPIQSLHRAVPGDLAAVRAINLSDSGLTCEDLVHIDAQLDLFPACKEVDLSNNRIAVHRASRALQKILQRGVVVVVVGCNLFQILDLGLRDAEMDRLIWIPRAQMDAGTRKAVVAAHGSDRVFLAHQAWYDRNDPESRKYFVPGE